MLLSKELDVLQKLIMLQSQTIDMILIIQELGQQIQTVLLVVMVLPLLQLILFQLKKQIIQRVQTM